MYERILKKVIDLCLSVIALIILSPVLVVIIVAIKFGSKGPILFKQKRVGKYNEPFMILKFRTMTIETPKDCPTHLLKNPDQYITKVGKFMRKTSLDELPQLINIIKGDMSIVGPRPSLFNQTDLNKLRDLNGSSQVLPGLTGLAQISGRDELAIEVKARLDGEYAKNITFAKDLRIFALTLFKVISHEGVSEGKK